MIKPLILNKYPLFWFLFHIFFGVLCTFTTYPLIIWFYLTIFSSISYISRNAPINNTIIFFIGYIISFEMISRMSGITGIIPQELGKYMLFVLLMYGIFIKGYTKGKVGFLMAFLLLPALLFDASNGKVRFLDVVFNFFGPLNTALGFVFFYQQKISFEGFKTLLRLMLYPCLMVLAFAFFKTPDYDDLSLGLKSTYDASGGFPSNQVSTALGLGAFLVFIFIANNWKLSSYKWLDIILLIGFLFQGLLTFSRGGMIGFAFAVITMSLYLIYHSYKYAYPITSTFKKMITYLFIGSIVGGIIFTVVDNLSGGNLTLRYQGETQGTLLGSKEKNLNTLTSGREEIFEYDLKLFEQNLIFGVGVAASRYVREKHTFVQPHVELSRLIAEHGILGLFYFILLLYMGFYVLNSKGNATMKSIQVALFMIAFYTTFHAAMRTYVSPLLFNISVLSVVIPSQNKKIKSEILTANI